MNKLISLLLTTALLALSHICSAQSSNQTKIPLQYFGLHIHRADEGTPWPNVPFGSWRLWDAHVSWAQLEPKKGQWDFSRLDRYVAMAGITKVDILLPLAMTPKWASARPEEPSAYQLGNVAEPKNLADWTDYVAEVGKRYKGKIFYYEIWNEPSDKTHYSGDIPTLVKLTCEAKRVLKGIDPAIKIVSPASAGGGRHIEYLDRFLAAGGAGCIDIVAHHFYLFKSPPEAMVPLIRAVKKVMAANRVGHLPLWNTETGYWIESKDQIEIPATFSRGGWKMLERDKEAGDYITKALLLARAEGIDRFYWYAWDNRIMGLIEPKQGTPKPAVGDLAELLRKLVGATQLRCFEEYASWRCSFLGSDGEPHTYSWDKEK